MVKEILKYFRSSLPKRTINNLKKINNTKDDLVDHLLADVTLKWLQGRIVTSLKENKNNIVPEKYGSGIMFRLKDECYILFKYVEPGLTKLLTYDGDEKVEVIVRRDYKDILSNFIK